MNLITRIVLFVAILLAAQVLHVVACVRFVIGGMTGSKRTKAVALGWDLLGNAVLNGTVGELISTRANRARADGKRWGCVLCTWLDRVDPNHCANSPTDLDANHS